MWDWAHLKGHGWLRHLDRAGKLTGILLLGGLAMLLHTVIPFWQQPKGLQVQGLINSLEKSLEPKQE
jgi:hypothetical protein